MPTMKTSSQFWEWSKRQNELGKLGGGQGFETAVRCVLKTVEFQGGSKYPRVGDEGAGPVPENIDEKLENEDNSECEVEVISHLPQFSRRAVAEGHLASILGLKDADKEVLRRKWLSCRMNMRDAEI